MSVNYTLILTIYYILTINLILLYLSIMDPAVIVEKIELIE
jgi:hypothetical protein